MPDEVLLIVSWRQSNTGARNCRVLPARMWRPSGKFSLISPRRLKTAGELAHLAQIYPLRTGASKGIGVYFTFGKTQIQINMPTRTALEDEIRRRFRAGQGFALATVNLDHLVKMSASAAFAATYAQQDLIVADGRPIVALSKLSGDPVDLLPGSDLVMPLCRLAAQERVRLALVGSTQTALDDAKRILSDAVPGLDIALAISPSGQFDPHGEEAGKILQQLRDHQIGFCFLALGAPKQEELALRGRDIAPGTGFASVGAGLDFLGGHQVRAPKWMRRLGIEWVWRAIGDPARMVPRYAKCAAILPRETVNALRQRRAKP